MPSKSKNEAKRGPEKSEEWWACETNERHKGAKTLFDRKFRSQRGRNAHARHVQHFLLASRSSKAASSGHHACAFWAEILKLGHQSANKHQAPCQFCKNLRAQFTGMHRDLCSCCDSRGFRHAVPQGCPPRANCASQDRFSRNLSAGLAPLGTCGVVARQEQHMSSFPNPRHTACAPPRHPNRPGARLPRARTSQRETLAVHSRGAVPRCVRRAHRGKKASARRDPSPRAACTLPLTLRGWAGRRSV